jgi:hypothetical protein
VIHLIPRQCVVHVLINENCSFSLLLLASSIQGHITNPTLVMQLMLIKINMKFCVNKVDKLFTMCTHFLRNCLQKGSNIIIDILSLQTKYLMQGLKKTFNNSCGRLYYDPTETTLQLRFHIATYELLRAKVESHIF